jgi:hypothetical protein
MEEYTIILNFDASGLIGKDLKDENKMEIGRITSFLINSSGRVEEVLVEANQGQFVKYPVERLKIDQNEVSLASRVDREIGPLSEKFPIISKRRRVLEELSEKKVIPPQVYKNLRKEFDNALKEMKSRAQNLLEDMDKQVKDQEDYIRTLQLARAFLEIEHAMDTVEDEVYRQSTISLLREIKNASRRKLGLLSTKDKVSSVLLSKEEEPVDEPKTESTAEPKTDPKMEPELTSIEAEASSKTESTEEEQAITVRVTPE